MKLFDKTWLYVTNVAQGLFWFLAAFFGVGEARKSKGYWYNWWVMFDRFANAVTFGDYEETLSSRMGKQIEEDDCSFCAWICKMIDKTGLDPFPNHCKRWIDRSQGDWSNDDDNVIN